MKPTTDEMLAWAQEAGWMKVLWKDQYADGMDCIKKLAALAYAAGRDAGLERAAEVCDLMEEHYQETEFYKYAEMRTDAEEGASQCAYSIRALKGEK